MKKIISCMLVFCIILTLAQAVFAAQATVPVPEINPDTSNWFSWQLPDEEVAKGTAIDASYMHHKPAGKYGFVTTDGEYLKFKSEDGTLTPARFWGTNITNSAFGDYEALNELANRVARTGYNIVRFHALDARGGTGSIFGNKNGRVSTTQIDKDQLDRLFYLMSKLKENGIYFYLEINSYRHLESGDEISAIVGEGRMGDAQDFCEELIQLQKEYAKELFTTVNPYTGLALKDDPALALVQLHNENSMARLIEGNCSEDDRIYTNEYYKSILNELFNDYLSERYESTEALENAWSDEDLTLTVLTEGESLEDKTIVFDYMYNTSSSTYTPARKKDTNAFVYQTVGKTYADMKNYIQNELGVKVPMTGVSLGANAANHVSMSLDDQFTDFVDMHAYNSHPDNSGDLIDGITYGGMQSALLGNDSGEKIFDDISTRRTVKPYIIGEYNQCIPNPYGAETEVLMAAMASLVNWYPFNYLMSSNGHIIYDKRDVLYDTFTSFTSPVRTAIQPSAATMYLRGDIVEHTKRLEIPVLRDNLVNNTLNNGGYQLYGYINGRVKPMYKIYDDKTEYEKAIKNSKFISDYTYYKENLPWN